MRKSFRKDNIHPKKEIKVSEDSKSEIKSLSEGLQAKRLKKKDNKQPPIKQIFKIEKKPFLDSIPRTRSRISID